ncbi:MULTISPECIES: hypothetical protein [Streptomyces]|uniref:Uncharacterized protein n=2 Tax=Streptomyces TaxID=1883 RepID=A0A0B5EIG1_STRA4|nr:MULTISPECIES: hypothetical protein [Streptomyces]AJE81239.1 hypothetical protein SLNWT_0863 [Streptomyces albus]AOU75554.1 hypothetical protein SLNHY_0863 [Streptomyces albus]AYN31359.1 hypothetical protein DUI70_0856 [Streptomyces albus]NKI44225.1 hypothetical protein [Streptomyces physcomitrii]
MNAITFEELDGLTGELLPERAVLSTVVPFNNAGGHDGGGSSSSAVALGGGDSGNHGAISSSACQAQQVHGTPGLVGALGLGSNNPSASLTCVPTSLATY